MAERIAEGGRDGIWEEIVFAVVGVMSGRVHSVSSQVSRLKKARDVGSAKERDVEVEVGYVCTV